MEKLGELLSMSSSLSRFSGWRSRSLSLGEGLTDSTGARDGTRADGALDRGAAPAFFFLALLLGGAVELPGRSRPAPGVSTFAGVSLMASLAERTASPWTATSIRDR